MSILYMGERNGNEMEATLLLQELPAGVLLEEKNETHFQGEIRLVVCELARPSKPPAACDTLWRIQSNYMRYKCTVILRNYTLDM